ncbi:MAG: PorP/SprF family type IX secretion system membrane protein [Chitinophagales bacterium]
MKHYITWMMILLIGWRAQAQDMHSSQFYAVPSNINPAFTGFINNDYYVAASYKTQWRSISMPYQTISGNAEISLLKNKFPNSILGAGVAVVHDRAGSTNFTNNQVSLNVSFLQVLDVKRNHIIGVGFQNGISMRKFDYSKATFENQFNGFDGFDPSLDPIENGLRTSQVDYNLGIGGLYSFAPKEHYNFFASFSAFNLTRPNISFYESKESRLFTRYAAFTGGEFMLKDNWSMQPSFLFQKQGPNMEIVFGSFARYGWFKNRKELLAINFGAWYRVNDALIPAVKLEYKGFNVTFNYDINVSKLTKVSRFNGSGEISISYSGRLFKERVKPVKPVFCPSFAF